MISHKVRAAQKSSKVFFVLYLRHLIEQELLITKIHFHAWVNTFFRLKNAKYPKVVVFREKHIFIEICKISSLALSLSFYKQFL
jgi:hypothetical protein